MRRSTKIWMTIAGGLLAAGIVILLVGHAMGGYDTVRNWVENGELSWSFGFHGLSYRDSVKFNNKYPTYEGDVARTRIEGAGQIERLRLDAGGGLIRIQTSEDGGYWFSSDNAKEYQCYAESGSIELRVKGGTWVNNHSYDHVITLWLPKDESYREIDLDIGGGILSVETLSGDEISVDAGGGRIEAEALIGNQIEMDLGAGEIAVQRVEADRFTVDVGAGEIKVDELETDKLKTAIGAGQITLSNSTVHEADISVSMGQILYQGTVTGDLEANCSMGQINLELDGKKEDHNYVIDCSMGEIKLDGDNFGGMGASQTISNGADSDFELECSMGGIVVKFGQS